jgi:hypothetical protein
VVSRDDVQLAASGAKAPVNDDVAALFELFARQIFAAPAQRLPLIHARDYSNLPAADGGAKAPHYRTRELIQSLIPNP